MDSLGYSTSQRLWRDQNVLLVSFLRRFIFSETDDSSLLSSMASLLHVHLGVDDEGETKSKAGKARQKDQTSAERFHSFRDVHSAAWHERRDQVAQACKPDCYFSSFCEQSLTRIATGHKQSLIDTFDRIWPRSRRLCTKKSWTKSCFLPLRWRESCCD